MSVAFSALVNMNTSVPGLISVRAVFYREQASSMYSSFAYSLSLLLVELPYLAMIILCSSSVGYFMFGLRSDAGAFFFHYLITFTLGAVYISIGQFVSALVPTFEVAQAGAFMYCAMAGCACRARAFACARAVGWHFERAAARGRSRQRCAAHVFPASSIRSARSPRPPLLPLRRPVEPAVADGRGRELVLHDRPHHVRSLSGVAALRLSRH